MNREGDKRGGEGEMKRGGETERLGPMYTNHIYITHTLAHTHMHACTHTDVSMTSPMTTALMFYREHIL